MSARSLPRLYIITDRKATNGRDVVDVVAAALEGAPAIVQLREKDLDGGAMSILAARMLEVTRRHHVPLLINDRVDVAVAVGADGVHLPERSFSVAQARELMPPGALIGVSRHDVDGVERAHRAGADLVVCGPIYATPSKPDARPMGISGLRDCEGSAQTTPLFALGGIDGPDRAAAAMGARVHGIAAIRAFMSALDPRSAAAELARRVTPT